MIREQARSSLQRYGNGNLLSNALSTQDVIFATIPADAPALDPHDVAVCTPRANLVHPNPKPEPEKLPMTDANADIRFQLAVANRIIAGEGIIDAFGHLSVRHPGNPQRYFISRSRSPQLVSPDDILSTIWTLRRSSRRRGDSTPNA